MKGLETWPNTYFERRRSEAQTRSQESFLVHLGLGVTLAPHESSKQPRRWSMRPDRVQIEPAGVTAGKSFSGSKTLLKKFVSEYMATSATISMTFASV